MPDTYHAFPCQVGPEQDDRGQSLEMTELNPLHKSHSSLHTSCYGELTIS